MASSSQQNQERYGYEDSRFQNVVSESFHCPICLNVLRQPKMCRNNGHVFCQDCIMTHLQNDRSCPECRDELTVETLKPVSRALINGLSELCIRCDYHSRGCLEFVQVGNLDRHVVDCGFAPVNCSNDGCKSIINERDKNHHEADICQFRRVPCNDCRQLVNEMRELRQQFQSQNDDQKQNQQRMREQLIRQNDDFDENQRRVTEQVVQLNQKIQLKNDETKALLAQINDMQAMLVQSLERMKTNSDEVKRNLAAMQEQLGQLSEIQNSEQDAISSPTRGAQALRKKDFGIVGGEMDEGRSKSVEIYSWEESSWTQLPDMNEVRGAASSFVYQNEVFIAGGYRSWGTQTDNIEVINTVQEPLKWKMFPAKLPAKLSGHKTVVYNNKVLRFGGVTASFGGIIRLYSNNIYETLLVAPYSTKLLATMPGKRAYHGAELVNNKIFILGGRHGIGGDDTVNSVYNYDVVENKCEEMAPLPNVVSGMATVVWKNKIVVIGGEGSHGETLSEVLMYDVETGESETLPSMKYKRRGCSAVAIGDGIVVMGGYNKEDKYLRYVEYFNMSSGSWKELPPMSKPRSYACAFVKP